jgi:hypothetical protein
LLIAIVVVVTVAATLIVVPGPVNNRVQLLVPVRR